MARLRKTRGTHLLTYNAVERHLELEVAHLRADEALLWANQAGASVRDLAKATGQSSSSVHRAIQRAKDNLYWRARAYYKHPPVA